MRGVALVVVALLLGSAAAQTLSFGATGFGGSGQAATGGSPAASPWIGVRFDAAIEDAKVAGTTVRLGLAVDDQAQLDVTMRANQTFGPVGNVIFEGQGAVRTDGAATGTVGVRGVLGPVALGLSLSAFGADAERFDRLAVASDARPAFALADGSQRGWGVRLQASARPSRALVVQVAPDFYHTADGSTWRIDGRVRWLRAIGPDELSVRVYGSSGTPMGSAAALGVGYTIVRRRAQDIDVAAFVGTAGSGWLPGATADLGQDLGGGVNATLSVALEPYRVDVAPYRTRLDLRLPTRLGEASASVAAGAGRGRASAALRLGLQMPLSLQQNPR